MEIQFRKAKCHWNICRKKIPDSRAPQGRRAPQTALVPLILAHIVGAPPEVRPPVKNPVAPPLVKRVVFFSSSPTMRGRIDAAIYDSSGSECVGFRVCMCECGPPVCLARYWSVLPLTVSHVSQYDSVTMSHGLLGD